jgi:hypothetical protein
MEISTRFIGVAQKNGVMVQDKKNGQPSTSVYAQGGRFNYIYGGDINNDGSPTNDLIYANNCTHNCKLWSLTHLHFKRSKSGL